MARKDKYAQGTSFPRFYKADLALQQKIGTGPLDPTAVARMQDYLDSVQVDITPRLRELLNTLETAITQAAPVAYDRDAFLPGISRPLMEIKSESGMFHEMMVCRVSSFVLTFLEDVRKLDRDVLDIISAYVKVARMLLDLKIQDEKNPVGQSCLSEIRNATKRYYDKYESVQKA